MLRYGGQQFAKIFPLCADFRLRTCRATRGPADVRHAQLAAQIGLILTNQGADYRGLLSGPFNVFKKLLYAVITLHVTC